MGGTGGDEDLWDLKNYVPCLSADRVIVYSQFSNSVLHAYI